MLGCLVEWVAMVSDYYFCEPSHAGMMRLCIKDSYRIKLSQDSLGSKHGAGGWLRGLSLAERIQLDREELGTGQVACSDLY